jgi:hypothetical protein
MISSLSGIWVFLVKTPLLWLTVTLLIYLAALWLYRRSGVNHFFGVTSGNGSQSTLTRFPVNSPIRL